MKFYLTWWFQVDGKPGKAAVHVMKFVAHVVEGSRYEFL